MVCLLQEEGSKSLQHIFCVCVMSMYANLCDVVPSTRSLWLKACPKEFPGDGFCFLADAAASDDVVVSLSPTPSPSLSRLRLYPSLLFLLYAKCMQSSV